MTKRTLLVIVLALLLLAACGQPEPQQKTAYVGEWRSKTMAFLLT
jgi:major membrane immunogen (membrane-anchored lipoprotein)